MTSENDTTKKISRFSDGILLAALPAFSYAIAYAFESGVAKYYAISSQLIEITLPGTLSAFGYLSGIIFALWMMAEFFNPFWGKLPAPIRKRLALQSGLLLAVIGYVLVAGEKFANLKFLWVIFGVMLFFDFVLPALTFWDKRSYLTRIQQIHERDLRYDSVLDKIAGRIGVRVGSSSAW